MKSKSERQLNVKIGNLRLVFIIIGLFLQRLMVRLDVLKRLEYCCAALSQLKSISIPLFINRSQLDLSEKQAMEFLELVEMISGH